MTTVEVATTDTSPAAPALELRGVEKEYAGNPPVRALRGVDLSIAQGELTAVVGPSGSGKSTMLHVMGTLDRPTAGSVHIAGHEVSSLSDRRLSAVRSALVGFVFQQFFLLDGETAVDNVASGLLYTGTNLRKRRQAAAETLDQVGLGHRLGHHPNELSGGERQRVAIARALVNRPAIVLADEPTGNLDSQTSESIEDLLRELNDAGATIIVVTHDNELAGSLPRQVRFLDGRIEHDSGAP
ncbi:MAG: ABC transporter ATP-binding protein [Acidimicrobiales bacterium]